MKIGNINELRGQLIDAFEQVQNDQTSLDKAKGLSDLAGKVIKTAKLELEYAVVRKEKPEIPFLSGSRVVTE